MSGGFGETLAAAQAGEEWALAALWRDLNPRVLRFLAVRHREDAEDVAAETWVRAIRGLDRFRGDEVELRAWFFTIARRTSIDWIRRTVRRPTVALDPDVELPAARDDVEAGVMDAIATEAALGLVRRLPADQAEVVLLRVVAGLDTERVGAIVGKRPGTVRVLQHRALRQLAEMVELVEKPSVADLPDDRVTP